jgi:hypothetical protein
MLLAATFTAGPAHARLGETVSDLKKRFGRPELESRGNNVFWLFEGDDGQLLYTVTLNAAGRSIAEGLKPHKRARFHETDAHVFISSQLEPWENSKTLRTLKPGERYHFAGQNFVCEPNESVMVDEPNGVLLVWNKSVNPSVMVIAPELLLRSR